MAENAAQAPCRIARVAVDVPVRKAFDYLPPAGVAVTAVAPGMRVRAPFGKTSVVGMVLSVREDRPRFTLKRLEAVLDDAPLLDRRLLEFLQWSSDYYHHPIGEVIANALPKRLRAGKGLEMPTEVVWRACAAGDTARARLARAPKQLAVFEFIATRAPCPQSRLKTFGNYRAALANLAAKGLIAPDEADADKRRSSEREAAAADIELTDEQQTALERLLQSRPGFKSFLLFGVTGSGKTEVYLRAATRYLSAGRQVLVLVPEIGLTPQIYESFARRLDARITLSHSGLSDGERHRAWADARTGRADIIIGTRSAVFMPLARPGLVILDEEHDPSFKQTEGFKYSARDIAIKRAAMLDTPILLGSATPSCESLNNAESGKSRLLMLTRRVSDIRLPDMFTIDMRGRRHRAGFSQAALEAIDSELRGGGQALIFLNRRGYAPVLLCEQCGWVAECHHCDIRMTLHKRDGKIRCHVCAHEKPQPRACSQCGHAGLYPVGQGTEKLQEFLERQFPGAGVIRVDRDTTRRKHAFADIIRAVRGGEFKLLIGTQMLAKGHHFPQVGTVIITDADNGLYGLDFRAQEHMAQLITQVAGRAGRAARRGKVYIQTWHPEHALLQALATQRYDQLCRQLLAARRAAAMPPFGFLALMRAEARKPETVEAFMREVTDVLARHNRAGVELLGPAAAPLERKAGYHRMQLLLKADSRAAIHRLLGACIGELERLKGARRARWSFDVDPYHLY